MKKLLLILTIFQSALFAAEEAPKSPRYQHLQDADGVITATIDTKNKTVDIKGDPKEIIFGLVSQIQDVYAQCQKQMSERQPKPEPKKSDKLKK